MAITFVNSTYTTAQTQNCSCSAPSGCQDGDILIAYAHLDIYNPYTPAITLPSGWTQIDYRTSTYDSAMVAYRIFQTGDTSWTWNGDEPSNIGWFIGIQAFRGVDPDNPINAHNEDHGSSGSTISAAAITTDVDGCMLLFAGSCYSNGTASISNPTINSVAVDSEDINQNFSDSDACAAMMSHTYQSSAGSTGNASASAYSISDFWMGWLCALAPIPDLTQKYGESSLPAAAGLALAVEGGSSLTTADTGWVPVGAGATSDRDNKAAWSNPGNITSDDATYSSVSVGKNTYSDWLTGSAAALSAIPADAEILGIEVRIDRYASNSGNINDDVLQLGKSGTRVGDDKGTSTSWPTSAATADYGGADDLWGTTWTRSEIVNDLEVWLSVDNTNTFSSRTAYVDIIWVKITYQYVSTQTYNESVGLAAAAAVARTNNMSLGGSLGLASAAAVARTNNMNLGAGISLEANPIMSTPSGPMSMPLSLGLAANAHQLGISPHAVNGDMPDYGLVPQFDHYYDLNNSLADSPGSGKSQLNANFWYADPETQASWVEDWAGRSNQAVFNPVGTAMYVAKHNDFQLDDDFTLFTEVKTPSTIAGDYGFAGMISWGPPSNGWLIYVEPTRTAFGFRGDYDNSVIAYSGDIPFATDTWYQLVITRNATTGELKFYINGLLYVTTNYGSGPLGVADANTDFGIYNNTVSRLGIIKGTIFTPAQIKALYDTWVYTSGATWKRHPDNPESIDGGLSPQSQNIIPTSVAVEAIAGLSRTAIAALLGGVSLDSSSTLSWTSSALVQLIYALTANAELSSSSLAILQNIVSLLISTQLTESSINTIPVSIGLESQAAEAPGSIADLLASSNIQANATISASSLSQSISALDLQAQAGLVRAGLLTIPCTISFSSGGDIIPHGGLDIGGDVSLEGGTQVEPIGMKITSGVLSLPVLGELIESVTKVAVSSLALDVQAIEQLVNVLRQDSALNFDGQAVVDEIGTKEAQGTIDLSSDIQVDHSGTKTAPGVINLTGLGQVTEVATMITTGILSLDAQTLEQFILGLYLQSLLALESNADFVETEVLQAQGTVDLDGDTQVDPSGVKTAPGVIDLLGAGQISEIATKIAPGAVTFDVQTLEQLVGTLYQYSGLDLDGQATVDETGTKQAPGVIDLDAQSATDLVLKLLAQASSTLDAQASIETDAIFNTAMAIALAAQASFVSYSSLLGRLWEEIVSLTVQGDMTQVSQAQAVANLSFAISAVLSQAGLAQYADSLSLASQIIMGIAGGKDITPSSIGMGVQATAGIQADRTISWDLNLQAGAVLSSTSLNRMSAVLDLLGQAEVAPGTVVLFYDNLAFLASAGILDISSIYKILDYIQCIVAMDKQGVTLCTAQPDQVAQVFVEAGGIVVDTRGVQVEATVEPEGVAVETSGIDVSVEIEEEDVEIWSP